MIYVICGPTGSGKTRAAVELSKYFCCPIINADAFQVYKGMDIGTAKIEKDNPDYQNHYLLDIIEPDQTYSVKEYQDQFRKTLKEILKNHQNVIVCGGTGLYIKAALFDYYFEELQEISHHDLDNLDNESLYEMLKSLDSEAAKNIHPNNRKRVIRAIDIARNGRSKKSENISKQKHEMIYEARILLINPNREELYENINKRVDKMIEQGLVNEVKELKNKYNVSLTARQAIGYKEIIDYLDGQIDLSSAIELIKKRTRNYAKRQITFFKNQFECEVFDSCSSLINSVIN